MVDIVGISNVDIDIWVQIFELREASFSASRFPNCIFVAIEVSPDICDSNNGFVVEADLFWTCQNQIFCNFNSHLP